MALNSLFHSAVSLLIGTIGEIGEHSNLNWKRSHGTAFKRAYFYHHFWKRSFILICGYPHLLTFSSVENFGKIIDTTWQQTAHCNVLQSLTLYFLSD